jgi:S1-C subfamily serine protease
MNRRALAFAAALLASTAAGCVSPEEGRPLFSPLLAEKAREGSTEPVRWYLAEGGTLVESVPLEPPVPSLGIETEEWSVKDETYLRVTALAEDGWGGGVLFPREDLLGIERRRVRSAAEVDAALAGRSPGDEVEIVVGRAGRMRLEKAILGRKADLRRTKLPAFMEKQRTGLSFCSLDAETSMNIYGTPEPRVLLSRVQVGTPAWLAGLRRGDRVLTVEGRAPSTAEEAVKFLFGPPGARVVIGIETPEGPRRFEFPREEDVEASHGLSIPLIAGATWDRRYSGSYVLAGILWSRVAIWWNVPEREQAYAAETGTLLWLIRVRSSPESATLYLFGIPIRLR